MDDEFKSYGRETNKAIPEFKQLDAVEYYVPNDNSDPSNEVYNVSETQGDNYGTNEGSDSNTFENQNDLNNANRNSADGSNSPDINIKNESGFDTGGAEALDSTGAAVADEAGAATTVAGGSSAATASLAGTITVGAAAVVGIVAAAGGGIMAPAPKVESYIFESGTNYLKYEIDLEELTEGVSYKIRVSNATFIMEYPVTEPGVQRQIVTGLIPYRTYSVDVISSSEGSIIDSVYFISDVCTNQLQQPKAVMEFTPSFDYLLGTFDVTYEAFVSDYYKTGSNTYMQIYVGDELKVDDHELGKDSFFKGVLEGLSDLSYIEATIYTTYTDKEIVIGKYGYKPEYPEDFIATDENYNSVYSIKEPSVTYSDKGFELSIDTGFESKDSRDSYIIDIYKSVEASGTNLNALEQELLATYEGKDRIFNVTIPGDTPGIDVYFTGVKTTDKARKTYESKKIYSYSMSSARKQAPEPVAKVVFEDDFDTLDDIYNENYEVSIEDIFKTGGNYKIVEQINNEIINEFALESNTYKGTFNSLSNGVDIAVIVYSDYNDDEDQIVIGSAEKNIEHDEPFKNIEFNSSDYSYYLAMQYAKEDVEKTFNINIFQTNKDESTYENSYEFINNFDMEGIMYSSDESKTIADVLKLDIKVSYNDRIIYTLTIYPNGETVTYGEFDVDSDGNVIMPYEITLPTGANFIGGYLSFDGAEDTYEITELKGNITITSLSSNIIKPSMSLEYEIDNVRITKPSYSDDINIGAEYEVSYYASHYNSYYYSANVKFDAKLNGKSINMDLKPEVLDGDEFVPIEDKSQDGMDKYNDYYVVNTVGMQDSESGEYIRKLVYKITTKGFDDTDLEQSVVIDDGFMQGNFSAGYEVRENNRYYYYVDYVKTVNDDGTVNYYFDNKLESESSNCYGRIEYSYTVDNVTKYFYSEYTNNKTIALTYLEDRDYEFKYAVYFLNDGIYYDAYPQNGTYAYTCKEIKNSDSINILNATVMESDVDREYVKVFDFTLDENTFDITKTITVTSGDITYDILIKDKESLDQDSLISEYNNSYRYVERLGQNDECIIDVDRDNKYVITIEIIIHPNESDSLNTMDISFTGYPSKFIESYLADNNNVNDILNYSSLTSVASTTICEYTGSFNMDGLSYETNVADGYSKNSIVITVPDFKATDSRDSLMACAYYNDEVVAYGRYYNGSITVDVDPAYTSLDIVIFEIKQEQINIMAQNIPTQEGFEVRYKSYNYETVTFDNVDIISDIDIQEDESLYVRVTPKDENTFADYYVRVTSGDEIFGSSDNLGVDEVIVDKDSLGSKLIVEIVKYYQYGDDIVYNRYEIPFDATIGEYTYDATNDTLTVPYEFNLPEGAVLDTQTSTVQYGSSDPQALATSGDINIIYLDSNVNEVIFNVDYEINGINVSYRFVKNHELHGEVDLNYEIYSVQASSEYGNFSLEYNSAKYDEDTQIIYIENSADGKFYDEDGNEPPNTETVYLTDYGNTIYYIKGTVTETIGKFVITNPTYHVNVKKAGGTILDQSTGELYNGSGAMTKDPNELLDPFVIDVDGDNTTGIYLTFFHTTIGTEYYNNKVNGINTCELEFDIMGNGNVLLTKSIEFTEPRKNSIPTNSSFSYSRENTNSTVTKNQDDTINMTINTGFDSELYPGYVYKILLYEKNYYTNDLTLVKELDDYYSSDEVIINNIENKSYEVWLDVYYESDGSYLKYHAIPLGRANSALANKDWNFDYDTTTYTNIVYIDKSYINSEYLDGSKMLAFKNGSIDLTNTSDSQYVSQCDVTVTDQGDGTLMIRISANNSDYVRGSLVVEQGNDEIGYVEITYSI